MSGLMNLQNDYPIVRSVRGKGLLCAIEINCDEKSDLAWDICIKLMKNGLLAKPTHGNKIRLAPPLCITAAEIETAIAIIRISIQDL